MLMLTTVKLQVEEYQPPDNVLVYFVSEQKLGI